jgi:alpha-ketoglutarate-dependent taurine dioxygenase
MDLRVQRFEPLGAEILGADIDALLHDEHVPALVLDALEDNGVLVFRELGLDDEQQLAFAGRLGEVVSRMGKGYGRDADQPGIYKVGFSDELNNAVQVRGAFHWHIDGTTDDIPSKASLLSCRSLPSSGGGDTQFASTYAAFDRLSAADRERFAGLKVHHSIESAYRAFDPDPPADVLERLRAIEGRLHPLVWTHRTGRRSLVLGTTASAVEGLPGEEGTTLLADLLAHATEPDQVFTYQWTLGDLVIWDNRGVLHRATPYAEDSGRMMHRVTLEGDEPIS